MTQLDIPELNDWINQQLPDAHPLGETGTDRARLALHDHIADAAARDETAACRGGRRAQSARPRRVRRGLQLGLSGVVAAGAAVAIVGVGGSGTVISPAPAKAATVIAKARRALVAQPGSVLEYQLTLQKGDDRPVSTRITDDPRAGDEIITQLGQPTVTTAVENGTLEFYDPATDRIGRVSDPTPAETDAPTSAETYADDLGRPGARVEQDATYDGRAAVRISWPDTNQGTDTYYCDPGTYRPIAMLWNGGAASGGTTIAWTGYQVLTGSTGSASAASLTARHPDARIDEMPYAAWSIALSRLYR